MSLQGKVAVVTGAAGGIGIAITRELLRNDAKVVVLTDINEEQGQKALKQIHEEFDPSRAIFMKLDTTNKEEFREAFKKTISTYGAIDIVVNNAGIMGEKDFVAVVNVNVLGTLQGTILALEYLTAGGIILNMSSFAAICQYFSPVYSASKAAVLALSLNYGKKFYYKRTKIKVITLCPGYTDTGLMERYEPEDEYMMKAMTALFARDKQTSESVAKAAIYALTNASSGTAWCINEGKLLKINVPDWIDMCELIDDDM